MRPHEWHTSQPPYNLSKIVYASLSMQHSNRDQQQRGKKKTKGGVWLHYLFMGVGFRYSIHKTDEPSQTDRTRPPYLAGQILPRHAYQQNLCTWTMLETGCS